MPPREQPERRGHAPLKWNKNLAETFGIQPAIDTPEAPREIVKVDYLPTPPDVELPSAPDRRSKPSGENPEDIIANILKEEAEELGIRLARFGVAFTSAQQQSFVDYGMAILTGLTGGGAVGRRQPG